MNSEDYKKEIILAKILEFGIFCLKNEDINNFWRWGPFYARIKHRTFASTFKKVNIPYWMDEVKKHIDKLPSNFISESELFDNPFKIYDDKFSKEKVYEAANSIYNFFDETKYKNGIIQCKKYLEKPSESKKSPEIQALIKKIDVWLSFSD